MSTEKNTQVTQEQEHLRGGQESDDMTRFREQLHKDSLMLKLIDTVGALCTQQFLTNQSLETLISELQRIGDEANELSNLQMRTGFRQADYIHDFIYDDDVSIKVNVDGDIANHPY